MLDERPQFPDPGGKLQEWPSQLRQVLDSWAFKLLSAVRQATPSGTIGMFGGSVAPEGWVLCDGTEYPEEKFPSLVRAIGTTWGSSGSGLFKVPDLRGKFPYGANGAFPLASAGPTVGTGVNASVSVTFIIKV